METCCLSIMMTIIIKQFPQPILYSGFSFREKVGALEVCDSSVYPVNSMMYGGKKTLQSYFIILNSIIIMAYERYLQCISLARTSSGNLFVLCTFLLVFNSVR